MKNAITPDNIINALMDFKKPEFAAKELGVSEKRLTALMTDFNIPSNIAEKFNSEIAIVQQTLENFDTINNLIKSAVPNTLREKFIDAEKYAETDDLIQAIVKTKADFMQSGFRVVSPDTDVEDFCNSVNRDYNIDALVQKATNQAAIQSNLPFYYKKEGEKILSIDILDPKWLEITPLFYWKDKEPQKLVIQRMSDEFKALYRAVRSGQYKNIETTKAMYDNIPPEIHAALNMHGLGASRDGIELNPENGDFVEIINYKGWRDRLVQPEMTAIFKDIRLRQMIIDGDYSIFYHIKYLIHNISVGSPQQQVQGYPFIKQLLEARFTPAKAQELLAKYKSVEKILVEVTSDNIKHSFIHPDPEIFDYRKYFAVNERILRNGGISIILIEGTGNTYSGGYIYLKSLVAEIQKWQRALKRTLEKFYLDVAPKEGRGALYKKILASRTRPRVEFDINFNKEPKQLLDEVKSLFAMGGIDWKTIHEMMGMSHEVIVARRKEEWEAVKNGQQYLYPIFEPSQSLLVSGVNLPYQKPKMSDPNGQPEKPDGEPGRPEGNGEQTNPDNRNRQPRPSEATLESEIGIVKKEGTLWYVFDHTGKKKLSRGYKTKKEANERLRQIEYFKNKGSALNEDIIDLLAAEIEEA